MIDGLGKIQKKDNMKHLKLFEGFYSDRLEEVMRELRAHMKQDLIDWVDVFSDEIGHPVKLVEPYISSSPGSGEERIICSIWIDFSKTKPSKEELKFICDTYSLINKTLKQDYKVEAEWSDIFGQDYSLTTPYKVLQNVDSIEEIKDIYIFFTGL